MNQIKSLNTIDYILILLWTIGFTVAIILIYVISQITIEKSTSLFGAFAILISAGIASASIMKNIAETKNNENIKHQKEASKFYLDKCTEGFEQFYVLLHDGNNNRIKWIEAARVLLTILNLSEKITEPQHKEFFILVKSKYRQKLYELYTNPINNTKIDKFFFTGAHNWKDLTNKFDELMEKQENICLDPSSVLAIFSLLDYPEDYMDNHDPLNSLSSAYETVDLATWLHHDIKKHAIPFIKYFQN